jgi:tripeptidyl-peptidase-1
MARATILVLLLVVLAALAVASASSGLRGFVSKRAASGRSHWRPLTPEETRQWVSTKRAAVDADEEQLPLIKAYVALKENAAGLRTVQESIEASSDPARPDRYGRHLEWEELNALVAPSEDDVAQVTQWLERAGVEHWEVMASRSWVRIAASAEALEALVKCRVRAYTPRKDSTKPERIVIQRCEEEVYEIPRHLDHIVDFVTPIVGFPRPNGKKAQYTAHSGAPLDQPNVTPTLLRKLYNITTPVASQGVNNTQAVFETEDSYSNADLQAFFQEYVPQMAGQRVKKTLGNLPNDPTDPDTEASLDIQYIMAIGAFAPSYSYNYNDEDGDEIKVFFDWVNDLANDPKPPLVHSVSYGEYGGDYPIDEVMRVSNEWMKLGSRGLTVLVASGDDGVGCNDWCSSFEFPYPSSPWITLVGATQVHQDAGVFSEIGSTFSTGGFSNDFGIPSWQASYVAYYLNNCPNLPASSYYNRSGRGLPDIAAAGENVQVFVGGSVEPVAGTSCSAPIIAGIVSLWNGMRLQAGKSSLGFINPFLYKSASYASAYYDVTSGNNADGCCPGFNAYKGWDPVTGLGTPNFDFLTKLVKELP